MGYRSLSNISVRKRLSKEERKALILEATKEICAKKGFSGTKLDDIAKKVGVSRALIIQHFGTKENLYKELIKYLFEEHPLEADKELLKSISREDDFAVFFSFFSHILKYMKGKNSPLRLVLFSMLEKPELYKEHYKDRTLKSLKPLIEYVRMRVKKGAFKEVNPEAVAWGFLGVVTYLILLNTIIPEEFKKNRVVKLVSDFIDALLKGLRREG